MNSNDLNALYLLPDLLKAGIHSYKIEGRMKSNLYLANAVFSYRKAIDYCYQRLISGESIEYDFLDSLYNRLEFSSNRSFCSGGFEKNFLKQSINYNFSSYSKLVDYVGSVKYVQNDTSFIEVKSPFKPGESLTYFSPFTKPTSFIVSSISNSNFENILSAKSSSIVLLKNLPDRNNFGLIFRSCN